MKARVVAAALVLIAAACGAPAASAPPSDGPGKRCMAAPSSAESGSAAKAAAPYEDCAGVLDMHCGGEDRYALCSYPLDVERTKTARMKQADLCCYGGAE